MTYFPKNFVVLLVGDAIAILVAATLLLRNLWRPAMATIFALFVVNIFLAPSALRVQGAGSQTSDNGRSKLWFWGHALLAAAFVRLAFFMQSGFSRPGLAGVIAGILLGTLFLFMAKKSKDVIH
jgi:hypothetical protein